MKKEYIIENLQKQYGKIKNRLREYGVNDEKVQITHGKYNIVFHCLDAPEDSRRFNEFRDSLGHDWSVKARLQGRILVVSYSPIVLEGKDKAINFVDLAPGQSPEANQKRISSVENAKQVEAKAPAFLSVERSSLTKWQEV